MEIPAFAKPVMFNQKRKIMVQTKEMKNYKTEVADNNRKHSINSPFHSKNVILLL